MEVTEQGKKEFKGFLSVEDGFSAVEMDMQAKDKVAPLIAAN